MGVRHYHRGEVKSRAGTDFFSVAMSEAGKQLIFQGEKRERKFITETTLKGD